MASKRSVRKRVAKALRKYVRGNASRGLSRSGLPKKARRRFLAGVTSLKQYARKVASSQERQKKANPPRVKGRKVKGGRAVTLRNFTGTIVKKADGTVQIVGKGKRK